MSTGPSGTVTLVFTDVQDSSRLWEKHGRHFEPVLALHNQLMREQIAAHGGYEVKTEGDAFMIAFADAAAALRFCAGTQLALSRAAWPAAVGPIAVRMGAHTGEPIVSTDPRSARTDYFGPVVNRAARVAAAGHGGQVLVSETTLRLSAAQDSGYAVTDLGEHRLRGLEQSERLFQVMPPELASREFPPLQTVSALPTNLPPQATSFIGRVNELRELQDLIAPRAGSGRHAATSPGTKLMRGAGGMAIREGAHVVTLVGPGGTGKTRLAVRLGFELIDRFEGGVWFVDLAAARSVADICQGVAAALGIPLAGRDAPEKAIASVLQFRKPLLLILDNFEQVAQHAGATIGLWWKASPDVRILATSRALLGIAGEREYELHPLSAPARGSGRRRDTRKITNYESVDLFLQRAREADSRFELNDENADAVAEICAELDGIPLAIELAAARVKVLKPAQMVKKLGQKFELLKSSRRDLGPRQQTLVGAIEWGFELLSDVEKQAFLQLCVFRGGFFLEAAEAVVDLSALPDAPLVLDLLQGLREKSLIRATETTYETRYSIYSAIREFGRSRWRELAGDPEGGALSRRHAAHYAGYLEQWLKHQRANRSLEALDRAELEFENAFAAQDAMLAAGDADAAAAVLLPIAHAMRVRGHFRAAQQSLAKLLPKLPADPAWACRTLTMASRAIADAGDWQAGLELARRAWEIAQTLPTSPVRASALRQYAESIRLMGRLEESLALFEQATEEYRAAGEEHGVMSTLADRGVVVRMKGRVEDSSLLFEEAERIAARIGDQRALCAILSNHGNVSVQRNQLDRAETYYLQAEEIARRFNDLLNLASVVGNRGNVYALQKRWNEAMACYEEALQRDREIGIVHSIGIQGGNLAQVYRQFGQLDKAMATITEAENAYLSIGDEASVWQCRAERATILLLMGRFKEGRDLLATAVTGKRKHDYEGSRAELRDLAYLAWGRWKCGEGEPARQEARALVARIENLPPRNSVLEDELDAELARLREVLA